MKNSLLPNHEVESLRTQVRQLRQSVAELENRLANFENDADADAGAPSDEDRWGIWPYCYFVSAWNFGCGQFHSFHKKLNRWNLARHNRRYRLQHDNPVRELRLT